MGLSIATPPRPHRLSTATSTSNLHRDRPTRDEAGMNGVATGLGVGMALGTAVYFFKMSHGGVRGSATSHLLAGGAIGAVVGGVLAGVLALRGD